MLLQEIARRQLFWHDLQYRAFAELLKMSGMSILKQ